MIKKTFSFLFLFMLLIVLSCSFFPQEVKIEKVEFNPSSVEVEAGGSAIIQVTVKPDSILEKTTIIYSVNDPGVVNVTGTNNIILIDGLKEGTAICSAKIGNNNYSFPITVKKLGTIFEEDDELVKYLTAVDTVFKMNSGEEKKLSVCLENGSVLDQQEISWFTNDSNIISITGNGSEVLVYAVSTGKATITVSHPDSINTITVYLNIGAVSQDEIQITLDSTSFIMHVGESFLLTSKLQNTTDYSSINWTLENNLNPDNTVILLLLGTGKSVTLKANSSGIVRVKAAYNNIFATCDILIEDEDLPGPTPTANTIPTSYEYLSLDRTNYICKTGDVLSLRAYISSSDFNNIVWTNQNIDILTMIGSGETISVKAVCPGQAKIKALYKNQIVYCEFLVEEIPLTPTPTPSKTAAPTPTPYEYLSLDITSHICKVDDTFTIKAYISGIDSNNIIWTNLNSSILTMLGSGDSVSVKAISVGQTRVRVEYKSLIVYCDFLVEALPTATKTATTIPTPSTTATATPTPYVYLSLDKTSHICKVGDVITIRAYISGTDFNNIVWTNLDNNILTILGSDDSVSVKAINIGQSRIRVEYKNLIVYCDFLVEAIPTATKTATTIPTPSTTATATPTPYVYLSLDKTSHICKVGDVITIRAYISGTDFNNIIWTNLNSGILTLLGSGDSVSIKAISAGQTKIKVEYKNIIAYCDFLVEAIPTATKTATATTTVTATVTATTTATRTTTATATKTATATPVPVFTISTDSINTTPVTDGTFASFTYTVSPDIVPVFTISDSAVATVTVDTTYKKVTVKALKEGLTQITCSAHNITKTIQVNCYYPELIFFLEESVIGGTNTSWYDKSYLMPDFSRLDLAECVNTQLNLSFKQGTVVTEIKWIKSTDFYPKVTTQILNDNKTINFNVSSEYNMFDEVRSGGSISCEITHNGVKTFFTITIKIYMGAYS